MNCDYDDDDYVFLHGLKWETRGMSFCCGLLRTGYYAPLSPAFHPNLKHVLEEIPFLGCVLRSCG